MLIICKNINKLNIFIVVFIFISLFMTGYIFYNSCQKPSKTNAVSSKVSEEIKPIVDPENTISKNDFHKYTRKAAHVLEFGALGISIGVIFVCVYKKTRKIFISLPFLLTLSVAVTDEFIQSFNSRTSCLKDVLIDFSGSLCGFLIVFISVLIMTVYKKSRR